MAEKIIYFFVLFLIIATLFLLLWQGLGRLWVVKIPARLLGKEAPSVEIGGARWRVELASDLWARSKGLGGRESLAEGKGMLFLFDTAEKRGFWMKGMKFPIDIIWINGNQVVGFEENAQPESFKRFKIFYPLEPVDKVLEVNAGQARRFGIKVGDYVKM